MQTITEHTMTPTQINFRTILNLTIEGDEALTEAFAAGPAAVESLWSDDAIESLATDSGPAGPATDAWVARAIEARDAVLDELRNMPSIPSGDIITQAQANRIARLALDGDPHYSHEAIGEDDGDINDMESETGGRRIIRADNDSEVAVYERADGSIVIVADANGPIAITVI